MATVLAAEHEHIGEDLTVGRLVEPRRVERLHTAYTGNLERLVLFRLQFVGTDIGLVAEKKERLDHTVGETATVGRGIIVEHHHLFAGHRRFEQRDVGIVMACKVGVGQSSEIVITLHLAFQHAGHRLIVAMPGEQGVEKSGLVFGQVDGLRDAHEKGRFGVDMIECAFMDNVESQSFKSAQDIIQVAHRRAEHRGEVFRRVLPTVDHGQYQVEPFLKARRAMLHQNPVGASHPPTVGMICDEMG